MAHIVKDGKAIVDWKTGDAEGDRLALLAAYRDFMKEVEDTANEWQGNMQGAAAVLGVFYKWGIDTENQIDDTPRVWIKRPE